MKTTTVLISACLIFLCFFVQIGCNRRSTPKQSSVEYIGAVLPLTGDAAVYGTAIRQGIDLAVSEINGKGGVNGKKIEVLYEDDHGQPVSGVTAVRKVIGDGKAKIIIGGAMSSVCAAIGNICQNSQVTLISPTATAPNLRTIGNHLFFLWPSDNYDGKVMADYAYSTLRVRRVAVLYVNLEYGKGVTTVFTEEFKRLGGTVVDVEPYNQGDVDFRAQLTKIKGLSPDALYLPGYYKELSGILLQSRELGLKSRLLSVNSFYDPKLLRIAGPSAEGAVFTYPLYDPKSSDSTTKGFVDAYTVRYGTAPDVFATQGYDAISVIAAAVKTPGNGDFGQKLRAIRGLRVVGGTISFEPNGDVLRPLRIMTVKKGKFESL